MSALEICKYDREIDWDNDEDVYNAELLMNKVIIQEKVYFEYLEPVIKELGIQYFRYNGEIRKCNQEVAMKELELLIDWVENQMEWEDSEYLLSRLQNIQKFIPEALQEDDDILYIF